MITVETRVPAAFAIWVTGLPASGKSTLVRSLTAQLAKLGIRPAVLESDVLRPILSPQAGYSTTERDSFYQQLAELGALLASQGIPVIFDATASRRAYRDHARRKIPQFFEVYVRCPLETCMARDPKGIYRKANEGTASDVPGLQAPYEPPEHADLIVDGDRETPDEASRRVLASLKQRGLVL
jgi:adenylylsulfate kinase